MATPAVPSEMAGAPLRVGRRAADMRPATT